MTASKVRGRKKSESRRAQLLEIAAKVFAEVGFKETGIERILKAAGLTGPALYRHFSSKQEMLDVICVTEMQHALEIAHRFSGDDSLTAEQQLRDLVRTRIDHIFGPQGHASILAVSQRAHLSEAAREQVLLLQREFRSTCAAMLKEVRPDQDDDEIRVTLFAVQNLLIHTMWRAKTRPMLSEEELKHLLERMVWSTLLP